MIFTLKISNFYNVEFIKGGGQMDDDDDLTLKDFTNFEFFGFL